MGEFFKSMKETLKLLSATFPNLPFFIFMRKLERVLSGCQSVLDIECGSHSLLALLKFDYTVGLDAYKFNIDKAKRNQTHDKYFFSDARKIKKLFKPKSFDAVIALDFIEHLTKKDGKKLLGDMGKIAKKRIVIFTPNGFLPQKSKNGSLEEHLSGWDAKEMEKSGYKVYGFYGPKFLRSNDYGIRFKPKLIWGIISEIVNWLYTESHPAKAKAILCVKEI